MSFLKSIARTMTGGLVYDTAEKQVDKRLNKGSKTTEQQRIADSASESRRQITADFQAGKELGKDILGDGLGRIKEDKDVGASSSLLRKRASEGLGDREEQALREKGLSRLQGGEQASQRQLAASLARSGVKGGAAGQMQVEMAAQNLQNRRQFETDLILNDEATKRKAELDFTNFSTKLAEFDLAQAAKEKNIMLQTQLATAGLGTTERAATKNEIAQENAAKIAASGNDSPLGTVLCTAMRYHGFISKEAWGYDLQAGVSLLRNKDTRKAFKLYQSKCLPLAVFLKNNKWAAIIAAPFIVPISNHFRDGNIIGTVLFKLVKSCFMFAAGRSK